MRKLTHSLAAKITAIFLMAVLAAVAGASALGIVYAYDANLYEYDYASFYDTDLCRDITLLQGRNLIRNYEQIDTSSDFDFYAYYAADQNNCRFTLYREAEKDKTLYKTEQPPRSALSSPCPSTAMRSNAAWRTPSRPATATITNTGCSIW